MAKRQTKILNQIECIAVSARSEFDNLSDYIWNSVRLIEHETRLERRKLVEYFPNRTDLRKLRWAHESRKLEESFPYFIAQGNFLTSITLFELRLLHLAKMVEPVATTKLSQINGMGAERILRFFDALGVDRKQVANCEQVSVAITIRNAVVHAGGALQYCRDANTLRNIVKNLRFWPPELRKQIRRERQNAHVFLINHRMLGERVAIDNDYAHWVTCLLRDYFGRLCSTVVDTLARQELGEAK